MSTQQQYVHWSEMLSEADLDALVEPLCTLTNHDYDRHAIGVLDKLNLDGVMLMSWLKGLESRDEIPWAERSFLNRYKAVRSLLIGLLLLEEQTEGDES